MIAFRLGKTNAHISDIFFGADNSWLAVLFENDLLMTSYVISMGHVAFCLWNFRQDSLGELTDG